MAGLPSRPKPKKDKDELRFVADAADHKKSTLTNISNKVYDHEVSDGDIKTKKH